MDTRESSHPMLGMPGAPARCNWQWRRFGRFREGSIRTCRVALDDVIDGLEMHSDEAAAYPDCDTGTVVAINDDIASLAERDESDERADREHGRNTVSRVEWRQHEDTTRCGLAF
jgi:hypothetical protein